MVGLEPEGVIVWYRVDIQIAIYIGVLGRFDSFGDPLYIS